MSGSGTIAQSHHPDSLLNSVLGRDIVRESRQTNVTTVRDSGSYLFHGSQHSAYAGRFLAAASLGSKRHGAVVSRDSKMSFGANKSTLEQEQQKQKMMNAILDMHVHT